MQVAILKADEVQAYALCRNDHRVVIGQPALRHQISAPADADHVAAGTTGTSRTEKGILSSAVYVIV